MTDNEYTGLILGGMFFGLDAEDVDGILAAGGLDRTSDLRACQLALRKHVGERVWRDGIRGIRRACGAGGGIGEVLDAPAE